MKRTTNYGPCPHCRGNGRRWPDGWCDGNTSTIETPWCNYCHGSGRVVTSVTEETNYSDIFGFRSLIERHKRQIAE